jgi:hypothetical protein
MTTNRPAYDEHDTEDTNIIDDLNKIIEQLKAELARSKGKTMPDKIDTIIEGNQQPIWISRGCPPGCDGNTNLRAELDATKTERDTVTANYDSVRGSLADFKALSYKWETRFNEIVTAERGCECGMRPFCPLHPDVECFPFNDLSKRCIFHAISWADQVKHMSPEDVARIDKVFGTPGETQ